MPLLARDFFATFSRFEFALKRGDFLAGDNGRLASPNWDRFADALGKDFFQRMKVAPRARIFFVAQPKKLMVIENGDVRFEKPPEIVNVQQLFEALRLVRNNLFHGEKAHLDDRDTDLMNAALFVLDSAFEAATRNPACEKMTRAFAFAGINSR